jgi:meiotically up-regulated gene 157 (Mug157) protein
MSDGAKSGVSQIVSEIVDATIKPVVDEGMQLAEQAATTVFKGPHAVAANDPQKQQQKQIEDQQKIAELKFEIDHFARIEEAQKQVRMQQNQDHLQQDQVKQEEKKIHQFEVVKKKEAVSEEMARSQGERRAGRGQGG